MSTVKGFLVNRICKLCGRTFSFHSNWKPWPEVCHDCKPDA